MIAVLGATGRVGGEAARLLADQPVEACALVRDPETARVPLPCVRADLRARATMDAALQGVTRLLLIAPSGPDQDLLEATAIDAAAAAGVAHVVKVSGGAASLSANGATPTATAHWRGEQRLEASGMGFTLLRPSMFQQGVLALPRVGRLVPTPLGSAPIAMIDLRDVAACAVAALIDPSPASTAWQLTGPRGVTIDEVAAALGARHVHVPPKIAARGLARKGASAFEVDHALRMAAYFSSGADSTTTDHVSRLTGRPPRAVESLLNQSPATL